MEAVAAGFVEEMAQGIQCGALSLAFAHAWARSIVEEFSVTPVPNAPAWLVGAANVEGEIVPVFDLAAWAAAPLAADDEPRTGAARARLLVGGRGSDRAALIFAGPARMVRYRPIMSENGVGIVVPARLDGLVLGLSEAPAHWILDLSRLFDKLATELATH